MKRALYILSEIITYGNEISCKINNNNNEKLEQLYNTIISKRYNHLVTETILYDLMIICKMKPSDILLELYLKYFENNIDVLDMIYDYNKLLLQSKKNIIYLQNFVLKLRTIINN